MIKRFKIKRKNITYSYVVNGKSFSASLYELKKEYRRLKNLSDDEFIQQIKKALHLSCIISFIKKLDINDTVGDYGLIHQLVHLLDIPEEPLIDVKEIRKQFDTLLKLNESKNVIGKYELSEENIEAFKNLISGGVYYEKDISYEYLFSNGLACKNDNMYFLDNTVKNPKDVLSIADCLYSMNELLDLETYCQIKRLKIYN